MKSFNEAVRNEPLGAIAILVGLVPFLFDVARDYLFTTPSIELACETPSDSNFSHEDGFLYYRSRCLIANQSRDPVSLVALTPVMLHGDYPYPMVGQSSFYPTLTRPYNREVGLLYSEMAAQFPVNLGGRESFAVEVVFVSSVGELGPRVQEGACSKNFSFEKLSEVRMCFDRNPDEASVPSVGDTYIKSVKEQIYQGYSYFLATINGFGLELKLGDGSRYILEADLTDVVGYQCNEEIRQLSCKRFGIDEPQAINIGRELDNSTWSLPRVVFLLALTAVIWISLRLLQISVQYIYRSVSALWASRR